MQQFVHAPTVIGDPTRHRRGLPACQAAMRGADVVDGTHQPHPHFQSRHRPPACPCPTRQCRQPGAERPIQPLDVRRLDRAATEQVCRPPCGTVCQPPRHPDDMTICVLLDHLADHQSRPLHEPTAPAFAVAWQRGAGHPAHLPDIGGEAVHQDQQRCGQGACPHQRAQPGEQHPIASRADRSAEPEPSRDHHRQRQPDDPPLLAHPDFVRLHHTQIARLAD